MRILKPGWESINFKKDKGVEKKTRGGLKKKDKGV